MGKRTFHPKFCVVCDASFTPASGRQAICTRCRVDRGGEAKKPQALRIEMADQCVRELAQLEANIRSLESRLCVVERRVRDHA